MDTVNIYFEDLNEETQKAVLELFGIESPDEENWDVIPLFTLEKPDPDE